MIKTKDMAKQESKIDILYDGIDAGGKKLRITPDLIELMGSTLDIRKIEYLGPPFSIKTEPNYIPNVISVIVGMLFIIVPPEYGVSVIIGFIIIAINIYLIRKKIKEKVLNDQIEPYAIGIGYRNTPPPGIYINTCGWNETRKFWLSLASAIISSANEGAINDNEDALEKLMKYKEEIESGKYKE